MVRNKFVKIQHGKEIVRKNNILDAYPEHIAKRQMGTLDTTSTGINETDNQFELSTLLLKLDTPLEGLKEMGVNKLNITGEDLEGDLSVVNNGDNSLTINGSLPVDEGTTVEGTSFTLTDAEPDKKASITKLEGNTSQSGTPTPTNPIPIYTVSGDNDVLVRGKNLCPTNFSEWESGQYDTSGNKATQTSRIRLKELIPILPNTTYYLNNFDSNDSFIFREYDSNKTFIKNIGSIADNNTFTTSTNGGYISITLYSSTGQSRSYATYQTMFENGTIKPLVCLNSETDKTYEPYVSNSYRIDLGKNLLNNTATTQTINGVTFTVNEDKSVTANGTATANAILILNSFTFESGKTYTLSGCASGGSVSTYKLDAFGSSGLSDDIGNGIKINVAGTRNVRIVIFSGTTVSNLTFYPQIELGTEKTEYSPYVSNPIELCKIGNYKDTIFHAVTGNPTYDNLDSTTKATLTYGDWYIEKNIGKVVLNGTENWAINRSGTANWYYYANISSITIITDSTSSNTLCDHYTWGSVGVSNTNTGYYIVKNGGQVRIRYGTEDTVANYKTWLGNNNVTLYYPLATPIYEVITNENLIQQLNNIQNMQLIENLCYVDWVGTEKPDMTLKYNYETEYEYDLGVQDFTLSANNTYNVNANGLGLKLANNSTIYEGAGTYTPTQDTEVTSAKLLIPLGVNFSSTVYPTVEKQSGLRNTEFDVHYVDSLDISVTNYKCFTTLTKNGCIARYQYTYDRHSRFRSYRDGQVYDMADLNGRRITAIGFACNWIGGGSYQSTREVLAVLDTSNYALYINQEIPMNITRVDEITSDAEFYTNNTEITGPLHLDPLRTNCDKERGGI